MGGPVPVPVVDALVVDDGATGLSAATWRGRFQCSTLAVDAGQHHNRCAERVHGLSGRGPITP